MPNFVSTWTSASQNDEALATIQLRIGENLETLKQKISEFTAAKQDELNDHMRKLASDGGPSSSTSKPADSRQQARRRCR